MDRAKIRLESRNKRAFRVRKSVSGSSERPRLCVCRTLKHISAQIIDDSKGVTLVQVTSTCKEIAEKVKGLKKVDVSKVVGESIAEKALQKGISKVVFDRKGFLYHGRVKSLADGARGKGLVF